MNICVISSSQNFMMLVTAIFAAFTVDVWFFYSKSLNCCLELRSMLDDDSHTARPMP